jgi:type II secretion system protein C
MMDRSARIRVLILQVLFLSFILASASDANGQETEAPRPPSLALVGVIIPADVSSALAVFINEESGKTLVLRRGEAFDDLQLVQVNENSVVLKKADRRARIFFGKSQASALPEKGGGRSLPSSEAAPVKTLSRHFTRAEAIKILRTDFPRIVKDSNLAPYFIEGKICGFKITRLARTSFISPDELREDDIIKEVNGLPLDGFPALFSLPQRLKNQKQLDIRVERKGRLFRLMLDLKETD